MSESWTDLMAPGGIEPPHAASKAAALSAELRGRVQRGYLGRFLATLCRLGGGSSVGRAPGCGPGGRGFESRPPPLRNFDGGPEALSEFTAVGGALRLALNRRWHPGRRPRRSRARRQSTDPTGRPD